MRIVGRTNPSGHSTERNSSPKVGEVPFRAEGYAKPQFVSGPSPLREAQLPPLFKNNLGLVHQQHAADGTLELCTFHAG